MEVEASREQASSIASARSCAARATKVKICGLMNFEMTRRVVKLRPDHIGFVFAPSRRQVQPSHVKQWLLKLREEGDALPDLVGVFANPTREELKQVLDEVPLTSVQLHGKGDTALLKWMKDHYDVQIWRTVPIIRDDERQPRQSIAAAAAAYELDVQYADVVLLDTHCPIQGGGSGKVFDWTVIPSYADQLASLRLPLYIAGGLSADNVGLVVREYDIDGVDVSSGVETNGVKDISKVEEFIERVRGNEHGKE
ncbi:MULTISPECIES: phosphoribosylanthranilate isomerase [Paenibacillus]|uniref:N-(5'-phosphoribosyl)anthranilate isomerase n=1 Tax=Paenibacillus alvei TaxID=44250 RepID=A0ABT4EBQ6_PAEAL|nr:MULTISPECIES: phosphoribosylanthranilate isomerase [Paenibacillus]EPY12413.1 phosphoribosylanthranilate isomerase [Paenibacillus alvei A6-6i-x]MCY9530525.1 phosphoribosylanthranilate isomerase [Paenibacillus alvei]